MSWAPATVAVSPIAHRNRQARITPPERRRRAGRRRPTYRTTQRPLSTVVRTQRGPQLAGNHSVRLIQRLCYLTLVKPPGEAEPRTGGDGRLPPFTRYRDGIDHR